MTQQKSTKLVRAYSLPAGCRQWDSVLPFHSLLCHLSRFSVMARFNKSLSSFSLSTITSTLERNTKTRPTRSAWSLSRKKRAKFFELLKTVEDRASWVSGRSITFPEVPHHNILCIMRQSRIAPRHGSGTRKSRGLTGNVGRATPWVKIVKILTCQTMNSWIWVNNWLTFVGFLSWWITNYSILACLARSVSLRKILLNFSISLQSLAWFPWKSLLLNAS